MYNIFLLLPEAQAKLASHRIVLTVYILAVEWLNVCLAVMTSSLVS